MHSTAAITDTIIEVYTPAEAIAKAAVKAHRIAMAAAEIDFARKLIRQVSLSRWTLLQSGMSEQAADALLSTIRDLERNITDAAYAADNTARDAESSMLDLADSFSK
jgi:hypothetical protein